MKNRLTYQTDSIRENVWLIGEDREKYIRHLDEAIKQFNEELKAIEKRCSYPQESPDEIFHSLTEAINEVIYICEGFEQRVKDKDVIRQARVRFYEKTNPILSKSYAINRARTWPQGYQGDYKTLESIYRNRPFSTGIGYYLDLFMLNAPLSEAVRNRIKKLEEMLRKEIKLRQKPSVLNIACGSCREMMGLAQEIKDSKAKVICIDNDNDALAFAQTRLSYTEIISQLKFYKYNVLRMFDYGLNMMEFGKQDIIYSAGLFDYLPSDFLVKMLNALYKLLKPGGKLIAAFKDADKYRAQYYHWLVDWDGFLQRTEDDFSNIFAEAGIPGAAIAKAREDTGIIIFYIVTG